MLDRSDLQVVEGDARVSCRRLAEVLGYAKIGNLHHLIQARWEELEDFGGIFLIVQKKSGRGRPTNTYLLNEHQATALCLWAETPKARGARRLIVEVFTAWRRGEMLPPPPARAPGEDRIEALSRRSEALSAQVAGLRGLGNASAELTHILPYSSGRRPNWWSHRALRSYVTEVHRQMTVPECLAECRRRFGTAPSQASLYRYWLLLDDTLRPDAASRRSAGVRALRGPA